ncbi:MAG: peptidylprolyl isomerase [Hyphomonadaceae bacterium]
MFGKQTSLLQRAFGIGALALAVCSGPALSQSTPTAPTKPWNGLTSSELIAAAPKDAWAKLDHSRLLYLYFEPTQAGASTPARVIILLAPDFAPNHVQALNELLAKAFFSGREIVRSQDNYVVQWGDGAEATAQGFRAGRMAAEFDRAYGAEFKPLELKDGDVYAPKVGFWRNWPVAWDPKAKRYWLPHCYGMVGAGRDEGADSGGPAELYAVNGHSPRALDRNVTLLGRVIDGMDQFTTLPRGSEAMGFYASGQTKPKIIKAELGSKLPVSEQISLEALRTDHAIYAEILESRRNRRDSWTKFKAGKLELCNAPLPVRISPKE